MLLLATATLRAQPPAAPIAAAAADQGVRLSALGPRLIRAVTHLDVTKDDCERAGTILGNLLRR